MSLSLHQKLKLAFAIWVVAFPVVACGPALAGRHDIIGFVLGGFTGLLFGSVLFLPWMVGVGVLYLLIRLTEDPRVPPR